MVFRLEMKKVNWKLKFYSHGKPNMKSFLTKFVFRINGGINFYFVCWGNKVVISLGLAAVASFFLGCFALRRVDVG